MQRRKFITLVGAAAAWPFAAHAQQLNPARRMGYLSFGEDGILKKVFVDRLNELGWVEGANLSITYRSAEGNENALKSMAAELVQTNPDVLVAGFGALAALALKAATTTIPTVFTSVGDPVGLGLVPNLERPGSNVTGLSTEASDLGGKRLQLISEIAPAGHPVGVLFNPQTPYTDLALKEIRSAAVLIGSEIKAFEATSASEVAMQFRAAQQADVGSVIVLEDPLIFSLLGQFGDLVKRYRMPTLSGDRTFVEAGSLMSYGPDRRVNFARAAEYVDKVLKGAKPADLPVEQPTRFELVINLKTAKALGLNVPATLLATADDVIE
jgi:putative ABC transport system substrate-binding protein